MLIEVKYKTLISNNIEDELNLEKNSIYFCFRISDEFALITHKIFLSSEQFKNSLIQELFNLDIINNSLLQIKSINTPDFNPTLFYILKIEDDISIILKDFYKLILSSSTTSIYEELVYYNFLFNQKFRNSFLFFYIKSVIEYISFNSIAASESIANAIVKVPEHNITIISHLFKIQAIVNKPTSSNKKKICIFFSALNSNDHEMYDAMKRKKEVYNDLFQNLNFELIKTNDYTYKEFLNKFKENCNDVIFLRGHGNNQSGIRIASSNNDNNCVYRFGPEEINQIFKDIQLNENQFLMLFGCGTELYKRVDKIKIGFSYGEITFGDDEYFMSSFINAYMAGCNIKDCFFMGHFGLSAILKNYTIYEIKN